MITLYSKDFETEYGVITSLCEALVEEERNGLFELSFVMLNTDSLFNYIKEENIVVANANDTLLNQKFRIYMTRKLMNNRVEVFARHISFDLMYDYIDNLSFENQSCQYALNQLFINSNFSRHYKGYSDIVNAQNYKMSMANILESIGGKQGSIIDTFGNGAEILRDNENIHILNRRGNDNEVTIEYRKNLTGFELEEDTTDLVTRILPYAKYNDEETSEEITVKASYVDSDNINNYSHPYIKAIDYSSKFEEGQIPTTEKLITLAKKEYRDNKVDIPKQNFKIEFIPLSKCVGYEGLEDKISLCDTVTIKDTRYNINTQAKVIKTVFNVLKNRYESMELGEPRTSLGDIIGNGGDNEPIVGPPGPQGPPGQDGNLGDFPNSLPNTPMLESFVYGFSNIELSWTFESKIYYQYELYASKIKDFKPNSFDLIFQGQASSYMFQAKPNETWYFKVCAINTYGERTEFSNQATVSTKKINDLSNYVENMAIGEALIGKLSLDRGWIGKLNANLLDVKGNFSVTDGNGLRTLDIDSFGNIHIKASSFSLQGKNVATEEDINKTVKSVDVMYYLSTSQTSLTGGTWTTTAPTWVNGKYMWSKTVTTYTDGTNKESSPTCVAGAKGDTGLDGVGVSEIIEEYYLSTSNTSQTGGTWTTSVPTWSKGKFIWTRSKIIYTNGRIDYTTPICDSTWQAIDQQTSEDVFNKLTDNGNKQGLYMQGNQLYVNGQYVNAKNLKVVNNEGTKTLDIDSLGNVNLDVASLKIKTKNVATQIDLQGKVSFSDLSTSGSTTINGANIITGTITGNKISGGIIEGTTLKTATMSSNGGVWIKENAIQLGSSNFKFEGSTFKIETSGNTSYSSTSNIYLMPGMSGGVASGNGLVSVSGNLYCNRLESSNISSSGNIYATGTLGCGGNLTCTGSLTAGSRITASGEVHAYNGVSKLGYYGYFTGAGNCYGLKVNNSYLAGTGSGFHLFQGGTSTYGYLYLKNVMTGYSLDNNALYSKASKTTTNALDVISNLDIVECEGLKIATKEIAPLSANIYNPITSTEEGLTQLDLNGMFAVLVKSIQELKEKVESRG